MVWFGGNLEDDVPSAVQCPGRLTGNVFSCCKNNIDVKYQYQDNIKSNSIAVIEESTLSSVMNLKDKHADTRDTASKVKPQIIF